MASCIPPSTPDGGTSSDDQAPFSFQTKRPMSTPSWRRRCISKTYLVDTWGISPGFALDAPRRWCSAIEAVRFDTLLSIKSGIPCEKNGYTRPSLSGVRSNSHTSRLCLNTLTKRTFIARKLAFWARAVVGIATDATNILIRHVPSPGSDGIPLFYLDSHLGCCIVVGRMSGWRSVFTILSINTSRHLIQ